MAYQTSGGGNLAAFVAALRDFAVARGWTNAGSGTNARGGYLFLTKGICYVAIEYITNLTYTAYTSSGGASVNLPDGVIRAFTGTGITTSLTRWWGHPGYPGTVEGSTANPMSNSFSSFGVATNGLAGTLSAWHLFSNNNGDYIHCAINGNSDLWTHFSFGLVDKGSMTHSGAAYVTGTSSYWARDTNTASPSNISLFFNKPTKQSYPFNGLGTQLRIVDALPAETGFSQITCPTFNSGTTPQTGSVVIRAMAPGNSPQTYQNASGSGSLLDHVIAAAAPTWSGQAPMYGIPAIISRFDNAKYIAVGMYPDVRFINMTGMLPGQEITLGTDVWKVFPVLRQEAWSSSGTLFVTSTGQYGMAYKKIP